MEQKSTSDLVVVHLLEENKRVNDLLEKQAAQIDELLAQLAWFKRTLFGRKSEKFRIPDNMPSLFDEELTDKELIETKRQEAEEEIMAVPKVQEKKNRPRKDIMKDLPVVEEVLEPEGFDRSKYKRIGEEHTRIIEFTPGKLYVRDIIRPKYALLQGEDEMKNPAVVIAKMPLLPINKAMAGASLLAEVIQQKYAFHLPFYRQIQQFKQLGIKLSSSTINDWYSASSDLLRPLYNLIKKEVLATDYIQVDETVLPVISKEKHIAAKRYLWAARSPEKNLVFFDYDNGSRSARSAMKIIDGYKGYLQCDGYAAYTNLAKERNGDIILLNCLAHSRRKFFDAQKENTKLAGYMLSQIALLYQIESNIKEKKLPPDKIVAEREKLSVPILDGIGVWIKENYKNVLPKSALGKAMSYTYSLLPGLKRYTERGDLLPDNNGVENAIRPITLGRKNFLFCGNHKSAENTAVMFTLVNCCKHNDVNIRTWLTDVLTRLPYMLQKKEDLHSLLPTIWKP